MRVQATSTEITSAYRDASLSDERRAEAVSTTAVANAEEKSTLGADAMHATMPLKKASFPGSWDATPFGRDEGEEAAVAPAAADATDWARACCALFDTRDASCAAVFACSISSSNRRRHAIVWLASSSARWARAAAYACPRGRHGRPGPGTSGGGALSSAESPGGGGGALSIAGGAAGGAPPGLARAGIETPPSPVEVGLSSSLHEPASRPSWLVGPGGGMVLCLLSRHRNPPPVVPPVSSRGISSALSLSRGHSAWGTWKTSTCTE